VTVAGLAAIVDQTDGVHLAPLIDSLCPDRAAADQTIRDIINTARDAARGLGGPSGTR
jgi:hypothetical protein